MAWSEDRCYIIAEAGSNHDGDLDQARWLIYQAAVAEADAVKFQCLAPLQRSWLPELQTYAGEVGLDFLATPFDVEAVKVLDDLDVPAIKVASPEIVNMDLLGAVLKTGRPVILSTGMASMEEISQALTELRWLGDQDVALLQCTTAYPAPYEQANLKAMQTMRDRFGIAVGLSDHTLGIAVPIAAAALGAQIIEKHFTLDNNLEGPDHSYALEPDGLRNMVRGIREAELALGSGDKDGPQEGEIVEARGRQIQWIS